VPPRCELAAPSRCIQAAHRLQASCWRRSVDGTTPNPGNWESDVLYEAPHIDFETCTQRPPILFHASLVIPWVSMTGQAQSVAGFQLFPTPTVDSPPHGIAPGPDGAVWFTGLPSPLRTISAASRRSVTSTNSPFRRRISQPESIIAGPDGNMWFTEPNAGQIGQITPAGSITEFTLPPPNSGPWGIVTGPDGPLWFSETTAHAIGRMDMSGRATSYALWPQMTPRGITSGPDGNLWFTDSLSGTRS